MFLGFSVFMCFYPYLEYVSGKGCVTSIQQTRFNKHVNLNLMRAGGMLFSVTSQFQLNLNGNHSLGEGGLQMFGEFKIRDTSGTIRLRFSLFFNSL